MHICIKYNGSCMEYSKFCKKFTILKKKKKKISSDIGSYDKMLKISRLIPFSKNEFPLYIHNFIYKNRKFSGWMNPLMKNNTQQTAFALEFNLIRLNFINIYFLYQTFSPIKLRDEKIYIYFKRNVFSTFTSYIIQIKKKKNLKYIYRKKKILQKIRVTILKVSFHSSK